MEANKSRSAKKKNAAVIQIPPSQSNYCSYLEQQVPTVTAAPNH
jgi:hypothetical protein